MQHPREGMDVGNSKSIRSNNPSVVVGSIILVAITLAAFWDLQLSDFVSFDDHDYILWNSHVNSGLSVGNLIWAFTSSHSFNWHPVTWLSHMLDAELFGINPAAHHWNSMLLHIANTLLLFWLLRILSGAYWRSAAVAVLFAVHPLHVESVAWASERKDVLSGLFWMLTLLAYVRYVRRPGRVRFSIAVLLFAFGLMSKPMVITLPFVLLLLDFWPLQRLLSQSSQRDKGWSVFLRLCKEKVPFFVLSAFSSVLTYLIQKASGAVVVQLPLSTRISNGLVSYVRYIFKMFWPVDLTCFYPYRVLETWQVLGSSLLLLSITYLFVRFRRTHPYLLVGWLWYLGTLFPVIGLIQVGEQAIADRYTYIPLIGLFLAVCWSVASFVGRMPLPRIIAGSVIALLLLPLLFLTREQVEHWRDSLSLFRHEVRVNPGSFLSHFHLATALEEQGRLEEAAEEYSRALGIRPDFQLGHYTFANALVRVDRQHDALRHYSRAIELNPLDYKAHNNKGSVLLRQGRYKEAAHHFSEALRSRPEDRMLQRNLALALRRIHETGTSPAPTPANPETRLTPGSTIESQARGG